MTQHQQADSLFTAMDGRRWMGLMTADDVRLQAAAVASTPHYSGTAAKVRDGQGLSFHFPGLTNGQFLLHAPADPGAFRHPAKPSIHHNVRRIPPSLGAA